MLVEEATGCKGPSRIFDKTSMKVGGVIDCELTIELPRDSKQVKNACQRITSRNKRMIFLVYYNLQKKM